MCEVGECFVVVTHEVGDIGDVEFAGHIWGRICVVDCNVVGRTFGLAQKWPSLADILAISLKCGADHLKTPSIHSMEKGVEFTTYESLKNQVPFIYSLT